MSKSNAVPEEIRVTMGTKSVGKGGIKEGIETPSLSYHVREELG